MTPEEYNPESLNTRLREAIVQKKGDTAITDLLFALKDKKDLDREVIVLAAEFGNVRLLKTLTALYPATSETQDHYDRALIGAAVNHFAPEKDYQEIVAVLLQKGANPRAYDKRALKLAESYKDKAPIVETLGRHLQQTKKISAAFPKRFN